MVEMREKTSLKRVKLSEEEKKAWKSSSGEIAQEPGRIKPQNTRRVGEGPGEKRKLFNLTKLKG